MRLVIFLLLLLALILIPFFLFESDFLAFGQQLLREHHHAWWLAPAIAGLLAADVFLPVPSSILSTAAGVLLGIPLGFLTNFAGMMLGAWLGFRVGAPAGERVLRDPDRIRLERLWSRWGAWTIVLTRPVPVLAEAAVVFAGASGMEARSFLRYSALANAAVSLFYAVAGAWAGRWVL